MGGTGNFAGLGFLMHSLFQHPSHHPVSWHATEEALCSPVHAERVPDPLWRDGLVPKSMMQVLGCGPDFAEGPGSEQLEVNRLVLVQDCCWQSVPLHETWAGRRNLAPGNQQWAGV